MGAGDGNVSTDDTETAFWASVTVTALVADEEEMTGGIVSSVQTDRQPSKGQLNANSKHQGSAPSESRAAHLPAYLRRHMNHPVQLPAL
jgi:hypothetical protein